MKAQHTTLKDKLRDVKNRLLPKKWMASTQKKISDLQSSLNTLIRRKLGNSDYQRWGTKDNLSVDWDTRTEKIARLVPPDTTVIEFGAGRLVLMPLLPESCTYTPSDLVDRGHGTLVCDLNSETLPNFENHDVAVFSGVLEYVNDVPRLLEHLSHRVPMIVASYAVIDTNQTGRRSKGWVNDYTAVEFLALFKTANFQCIHTETWGQQNIYKFIQQEKT